MKQFVYLILFSLASLMAQTPDYFPLVPGSTWVYRSTSGLSPITLKLGPATEAGGQQYYRLDGYTTAPVFIRQTAQGNLVRWDDTRKTEVAFLLFDGSEFSSLIEPCQQKGRAEEKLAPYKGPVGNSDSAKVIRYTPGICADAGLTRETFLPYLGLVQRAETSLIGERTLDLIYAQIGGFTYIQEPGVSFSISLTPLPKAISARLILQNRTDRDIPLQFTSSQTYDFRVRDERGEIVYTWSSTRLFLQVTRDVNIRGEEVWVETFPVEQLRPGTYSVEGYLTNSDGKRYSASATVNLP